MTTEMKAGAEARNPTVASVYTISISKRTSVVPLPTKWNSYKKGLDNLYSAIDNVYRMEKEK